MSKFIIDIHRKDHCLEIGAEKAEKELRPTYNLFYKEQSCGCLYCNENNVWIYEPHGHEALILSAEEIQHLGKNILEQDAV